MMKQQRRPSLAERILVRRRGTSTDTSPNDRRPNSSSSSKVPTNDTEKSAGDVTPRAETNPESVSIWRACQVGDLASVRYILATNPSVIHWMEPRKDDSTVVIGKYHTPLYYACRNGHTEIVQLLVEVGAQLDGSEILELAQSYQQNLVEVQERGRKTMSKTSKEVTSNSGSSNNLETPSPLVRTPSHVMIMSTIQALKKGPKRRKVQSRDSTSSSTNKTKRSSNNSTVFEDSGYNTDAAYEQQYAGYKTEEDDDDDDDDVGLNKIGPSDTTAKIVAALEQQDASRSQPTSDTVLSSSAIPLERKLSYLERLFHSHRRNNTNNTKKIIITTRDADLFLLAASSLYRSSLSLSL